MCKDDQNMVITQMGQILNRWKEYFCTLLNIEEEGLSDNQKTQPKHPDNQLRTEIPASSFNEVCSIINKLKTGKAGGSDNIIPELINLQNIAPWVGKNNVYALF
jgi:hypothetical protein